MRELAYAPTECLASPADPEAALAVEVGRAAFRTPLLLGGQAARAGLSCDGCHRSGRDNPAFLFPGISGPPGTADVTSSLFSPVRGDAVFDPKPIPDLSAAKTELRIVQDPDDPALPAFLHGLVVEEFDGRAPTPAVMAGLAAYVRALDPAACPAAAAEPVRLAGPMEDARRALSAAAALARRGEAASAAFLASAARSRLGLIDERLAGPELAGARERLRAADAGLAALAETLRAGDPDALAGLERWLAGSHALERDLGRLEPRSLFDARRLAAAYGRRLPR